MTVVIELPPEKEAKLRAQAAARNQDVGDYLLSLADQQPAYDPGPAIALLQAFATSDEWGTAEEQRETMEYLERVMDEDRPGQRRFSGKGYNPPADPEAWVEP